MATYSPALPAAMGYTVKMDEPAGYGVVRMLAVKDGTTQVWNPRDDSAQCFEVLCWLLETDHQGKQICVPRNSVRCWTYDEDGEDILCWNTWHKNTPASLRAAIVEAAERVAKENAK